MADFHVVSLTYLITNADDVTYDTPPPVEFETDEVRFRLADAKLTCQMKYHFSTATEARTVVDPVLRAWELDADLRRGKEGLHFQFDSAEVVDRTPVPPGIVRGHAHMVEQADTMTATATVSAHVTRRTYPAPPGHFRITPDVETLWHRYQGHLRGEEPLLAMAYFCLSVLKANAGGLRKAAAKYNIEERVLKKMGELTSVRGDPHTARKMATPATPPLSGNENAWIHETLKQIMWRLGDPRSLSSLPTITMADLPRL